MRTQTPTLDYCWTDGGRASTLRRAGLDEPQIAPHDCAPRAWATVTDRAYGACHWWLAEASAGVGLPDGLADGADLDCLADALEADGFTEVDLPLTEAAARYPRLVLAAEDHVAAVLHGTLHDEWDSRRLFHAPRIWASAQERS